MFSSGFDNVILTGNVDFEERRANFAAFRFGRVPVLVCTDVASRGIDVTPVRTTSSIYIWKEPKQIF